MTFNGNRQAGFTLFELIAVVSIIAVLAASGAVYYGKAIDDMKRAGVELLAHRFTAAVALAHGKWIVEGASGRNQSSGSRRLLMEEVPVYLNQYGWPANADGGSTSLSDQTAEECYQVWQTVLQNPAPATVAGRAKANGEGAQWDPEAKGRRRYHISLAGEGVCRYELLTKPQGTHYFEYNLRTGQVFIEVPPLD